MRSGLFILFYLLILLSSCRKDPKIGSPDEPYINPCDVIKYSNYTNAEFDFKKISLNTPVPFGPFTFNPNPDGSSYGDPVVNPNNPYEIAFAYIDTSMSGLSAQVWKFNFCLGELKKLTDNYYYNLDWSNNGWLLFTGTGHEIFKVKSNGDSLTQLSNLPGYNIAGKWSPDGSKYYITGDNGLRIFDANGVELANPVVGSFSPFSWMDEERLVGWRMNNIHSLNVFDESLTQLTNTWTCSTCPTIYNRQENDLYMYLTFGTGPDDDFFLKFDIDMNTVDTVAYLYDSYYYVGGSYIQQTDQLVTTLVRKDWKDSSANEVYVRSNILILNPNGTNEKLVEFPW